MAEFADLAEKENDEGILNEMAEKLRTLESKFDKLEIQTFLSEKYDKNNALLTISSGVGGRDSQDWASMLFRMYNRYCESKEWEITILHESLGEEGGIKSATIEVRGSYAYGYLKNEAGVHRLVRISPFSPTKQRHTSFAALEVLPEIEAKDVEMKTEDLKIDTFRSSGPGGQNVNKRETAIRITHELAKSKKITKSAEWGAQIRSYVFHPYQMVKDHRTNYETSQIEKVMDGDLEEFIEAELKFTK
ncbi:MAG: Peptide chain release factor 2 [Candidatus Azambacteria bacterium GW2011_GWA2_42_62]|nr:MAG: Peptide chain release factor 2 [Candidatus Azambacteria bacterium GW2011_GWA2_42_62]